MTNSMRAWRGCLAGMIALSMSGLAFAADTNFPTAPPGTPVAGVIGLALLAVGAVALGARQAARTR